MSGNSSLTRKKGLSPGCGLRKFDDELAAKIALAGGGRQDSGSRHENSPGKVARYHEACGGWHLYPASPSLAAKPAERAPRGAGEPRKPREDTGFSQAVRKAVRERAGYCCEACGVWLGEHGGQIQHRLARKSGGRRGAMRALLKSIVNASLLCGTPFTGCHGLCESRDEHMLAQGFRLEEGQDPALEPVMLHSEHGSGMTVWLTPQGGYSDSPPEGVRVA